MWINFAGKFMKIAAVACTRQQWTYPIPKRTRTQNYQLNVMTYPHE